MSLISLFTSVGRVIAEQRRRQRAYAELMALDDRSLADIGIYRSQIRALVEGERSEKAEAAPVREEANYWSALTRLIGSSS